MISTRRRLVILVALFGLFLCTQAFSAGYPQCRCSNKAGGMFILFMPYDQSFIHLGETKVMHLFYQTTKDSGPILIDNVVVNATNQLIEIYKKEIFGDVNLKVEFASNELDNESMKSITGLMGSSYVVVNFVCAK